MSSEEDFFSEFYYKIVMQNEGNVEVLSIPLSEAILIINNLITLLAGALM